MRGFLPAAPETQWMPGFYLAMLSDPVIAAMKQFPPPPPSESGVPAVVLGDEEADHPISCINAAASPTSWVAPVSDGSISSSGLSEVLKCDTEDPASCGLGA